jgi:hypothetical protein
MGNMAHVVCGNGETRKRFMEKINRHYGSIHPLEHKLAYRM